MILSPPKDEPLSLFFDRFLRTQQMRKMTPIAIATPTTPTTAMPAIWGFVRDLFAEASAAEAEPEELATVEVVESMVAPLEWDVVGEITGGVVNVCVFEAGEFVLKERENDVEIEEVAVAKLGFVVERLLDMELSLVCVVFRTLVDGGAG